MDTVKTQTHCIQLGQLYQLIGISFLTGTGCALVLAVIVMLLAAVG